MYLGTWCTHDQNTIGCLGCVLVSLFKPQNLQLVHCISSLLLQATFVTPLWRAPFGAADPIPSPVAIPQAATQYNDNRGGSTFARSTVNETRDLQWSTLLCTTSFVALPKRQDDGVSEHNAGSAFLFQTAPWRLVERREHVKNATR